jgi:hypothetical protein
MSLKNQLLTPVLRPDAKFDMQVPSSNGSTSPLQIRKKKLLLSKSTKTLQLAVDNSPSLMKKSSKTVKSRL